MADDRQNATAGAEPGGEVAARLAHLEQLVGAHNDYLSERIRSEQEGQQQAAAQEAEQAKAAQEAEMKGKIGSALQGYGDQENLRGALEHIGNMHQSKLQELGMEPEAAENQVMEGMHALARKALEAGFNPANALVSFARENGFTPAEAKEAAKAVTEEAAEAQGDERAGGYTAAVKAAQTPKTTAPTSAKGGLKAALAAKAAGDDEGYARLMATE